MREIGGYIELEYFRGQLYHENAIALNSGRHCVEYLIRTRNIHRLFLPYFMCRCVERLCRRLNVQVQYYHIDKNFIPIFDWVCDAHDWLYIVNYYGQLTNECLCELKQKYGNVIVDNAQAFFQKPIENIDTLYTCRKYFGVADGGYLYTDSMLNEALERDVSYGRMEFLMGRLERSAQAFYSAYAENNDLFESEPLKAMSKLTQNLLRGIDYERVRQKRTDNFAYLHSRLKSKNKLELLIPDGAYMYPLYVVDGCRIRKELQKMKLYIPMLWPDVREICPATDLEYDFAENILPLPVDQRYDLADMETICHMVLSW